MYIQIHIHMNEIKRVCMNKQQWFKVQVKTATRCDTTGFKCFFFKFSLENKNTRSQSCHT